MKAKSKKLTPLPKLLKKAEKVFNAWIRKRDEGKPCISCDEDRELQAGHYFPVKGHSELRFNEYNVNGQCAHCNKFLHGNQAHYRMRLIKKVGEQAVKQLEIDAHFRRIKKWSRSELEEIIKKYADS